MAIIRDLCQEEKERINVSISYKLKQHSTAKDWDISKISKFYETYPGTPLYQNTPSVEEEIIESLKTMDEVPIQGDE